MRMITRLDACTLDNQTSKTFPLVQAMPYMSEKSRKPAEKRKSIVMVM